MFTEIKIAFSEFGEAVRESLTSRRVKKRLEDAEESVERLCDTYISVSNRLAALERSIKKNKEVKDEKVKSTSKKSVKTTRSVR